MTPHKGCKAAATLVLTAFVAGCITQPIDKTAFQPPELPPAFQGISPTSTATVAPTLPPEPSIWETPVSVQFDYLPIADALTGLGELYDFGYAIGDVGSARLTYRADNISLGTALLGMAEATGLAVRFEGEQAVFATPTLTWQHYRLAYPNIDRKSAVSMNIAQSMGVGEATSGLQVVNLAEHAVWQQVQVTLNAMVGHDEGQAVVHGESGTIAVLAHAATHRRIRDYLAGMSARLARQVMIEMAILEVELDQAHEQGIDFSLLLDDGRVQIAQQSLGANISTAPNFSLMATSIFDEGSLAIGIRMLEQFGNTRVLSQPQLRALNNQTVVLKVVDNLVYFTLDSESSQTQAGTKIYFSSKANNVAVGLVVALTPYIDDNDAIILNVKPSISRVYNYVLDPHPDLARYQIQSRIPVLQERELESVLRLQSGQTAIIGGLMQQETQTDNNQLAGTGGLVGYERTAASNKELLILLRAFVL